MSTVNRWILYGVVFYKGTLFECFIKVPFSNGLKLLSILLETKTDCVKRTFVDTGFTSGAGSFYGGGQGHFDGHFQCIVGADVNAYSAPCATIIKSLPFP